MVALVRLAALSACLLWVAANLPARAEGEELARDACGSCHALPGEEGSGSSMDLVEAAGAIDWHTVPLRQWLATAHPYLPPLALTSAQLHELEHYLLDLRQESYFGDL